MSHHALSPKQFKNVTMYRGVPEHVQDIHPGDFVALDEGYAALHAEGLTDTTGKPHKVITKEVPEHHVEWAGDRDDWYQSEGEKREYFYRPPQGK